VKTGPFGTQMHASDYVEEGTPVINVRNIGFGSVVPEKLEYIGEETVDRLKGHLLRTNDIVFGRKGAVERHALIRDQHDGWFQGSDCLRLRINSPELSPMFASYSFLTDSHQKWMMNQCSHGATMASLNQAIVCRIPLRFPDMRTQNAISGILSAYDNLIKNNTRRIEILEEMSLIIYREWFVNFRFPGREKLRLVSSILGDIPEGWEIADLESVCVERNGIQTGPFGSQLHMTDYSDEGVPVVMPKDLIGFRIRTDEIARIPESIAEKLSRHRMQPNDIVYGRRGDIGRRAYLMPGQAGWFCGTGCLRIRPNPQAVNSWYVFNYLGQDDVQGIIKGRALGVTMPNLNTGVMTSVPVKLPPRNLQDAFARLAFPMAEAREVIATTIEKLLRTRDLLLPKLVSGEISVEQLEGVVAAQTV
jgi:type I restriction enzyme S subunit